MLGRDILALEILLLFQEMFKFDSDAWFVAKNKWRPATLYRTAFVLGSNSFTCMGAKARWPATQSGCYWSHCGYQLALVHVDQTMSCLVHLVVAFIQWCIVFSYRSLISRLYSKLLGNSKKCVAFSCVDSFRVSAYHFSKMASAFRHADPALPQSLKPVATIKANISAVELVHEPLI